MAIPCEFRRRAMEDCLITSITKGAMLTVLHSEPKFSELFMAYLLSRNSRIEEDLIDQLFNSSEKRLARLLLLLANFGKEGTPQPIAANVSQETLAEMIGTTRSRVSFFMNRFRKLGLIEYNGRIRVHKTLRMSPAMAAGVSATLWTMEDIAERIEARRPEAGPRGPGKKRAMA